MPFASGGPTDTVARLISTQLQAIWKQPVVLNCRPGAGTVLGTGVVAKSPPDGYTLGVAITALTINPSLQTPSRWHPEHGRTRAEHSARRA